MTDFFNNPSNDYIYPALPPCAGTGDDSYLKFLPDKSIGIISGSKELAKISFSNLSIPVLGYTTERKIIESGEVIFISGLTKGLTSRQQSFIMPYTIGDSDLNPYFMQVDLSINFYKNFKYTLVNICASANYSESTTIENALNLTLGSAGVSVSVNYDPSILKFYSTKDGYEFNVSNVALILIDVSENASSPFVDASIFTLEEDASLAVPSVKYPNSAMQGIIMRGIYPDSTNICDIDKWLYINKVTTYVTLYEEFDASLYVPDVSTLFERKIKKLDVGMNGSSTEDTMSAGDYLDWITSNNYWNKFGEIFAWASAPDCDNCGNLQNAIDGFYVYNPHSFPIQIEYLLFI